MKKNINFKKKYLKYKKKYIDKKNEIEKNRLEQKGGFMSFSDLLSRLPRLPSRADVADTSFVAASIVFGNPVTVGIALANFYRNPILSAATGAASYIGTKIYDNVLAVEWEAQAYDLFCKTIFSSTDNYLNRTVVFLPLVKENISQISENELINKITDDLRKSLNSIEQLNFSGVNIKYPSLKDNDVINGIRLLDEILLQIVYYYYKLQFFLQRDTEILNEYCIFENLYEKTTSEINDTKELEKLYSNKDQLDSEEYKRREKEILDVLYNKRQEIFTNVNLPEFYNPEKLNKQQKIFLENHHRFFSQLINRHYVYRALVQQTREIIENIYSSFSKIYRYIKVRYPKEKIDKLFKPNIDKFGDFLLNKEINQFLDTKKISKWINSIESKTDFKSTIHEKIPTTALAPERYNTNGYVINDFQDCKSKCDVPQMGYFFSTDKTTPAITGTLSNFPSIESNKPTGQLVVFQQGGSEYDLDNYWKNKLSRIQRPKCWLTQIDNQTTINKELEYKCDRKPCVIDFKKPSKYYQSLINLTQNTSGNEIEIYPPTLIIQSFISMGVGIGEILIKIFNKKVTVESSNFLYNYLRNEYNNFNEFYYEIKKYYMNFFPYFGGMTFRREAKLPIDDIEEATIHNLIILFMNRIYLLNKMRKEISKYSLKNDPNFSGLSNFYEDVQEQEKKVKQIIHTYLSYRKEELSKYIFDNKYINTPNERTINQNRPISWQFRQDISVEREEKDKEELKSLEESEFTKYILNGKYSDQPINEEMRKLLQLRGNKTIQNKNISYIDQSGQALNVLGRPELQEEDLFVSAIEEM